MFVVFFLFHSHHNLSKTDHADDIEREPLLLHLRGARICEQAQRVQIRVWAGIRESESIGCSHRDHASTQTVRMPWLNASPVYRLWPTDRRRSDSSLFRFKSPVPGTEPLRPRRPFNTSCRRPWARSASPFRCRAQLWWPAAVRWARAWFRRTSPRTVRWRRWSMRRALGWWIGVPWLRWSLWWPRRPSLSSPSIWSCQRKSVMWWKRWSMTIAHTRRRCRWTVHCCWSATRRSSAPYGFRTRACRTSECRRCASRMSLCRHHLWGWKIKIRI